ncbi:uncharacterized PE-PGRS family protein PE_PGRS54-like, partial [Saccostrea cucullata]|uniref:uncharacterized PE-PGRS family protein PE_PGRS54-like n=1 Tax=Saccostrea cuccullata TaxID=36930 RepID=UPI002ED29175
IGSGGVGGGAGIGEGLGLDGGLGIGTELGLGGGVGFGNNLDGFSTDLGMGISNDVAGTDRDFRLFASNVPGQLDTSLGAGGAGLDQSIPLDFSQLQAIDRLDFPLDGSQGIPNLIEPESSLMDSIPELNGPQLIDPSLGVAGSGGLIAMEAPDLGPVGLDPTALMELGGLVGGPMDPIMDVGTGQGRSKSQKGSKKPKKVTETVDIKVDVIKKGGSKDKNKAGKSSKKGQNMGVNGPLPGPGSFPTGIQSAGPLPGEMVDPAMFLGGSAVGGRGGALSGNGAIFDGGIIDTAPGSIQGGGMPESQLPPIGILVDGPSGGIMNGPNAGGLPGGLGGPGNMDSGIGALGGIGMDAFSGTPELQNGALGGMGLDALSASGTPGKGHSGIIGLEGGFRGNFDPQANDLGGLGLDGLSAVPMDAAGTGQMAGSGAGGQAFDPNALFDPVIQDGTGFNDQMSFLDPTQPNSGPVGEIPIMPDPQNGAGAASGGNINLDLSSLIPADMLGGLDLSGAPGVNVGGGVNEKGQGGPIDHGPSGGVIGLADMAPLGDLGGGAIGNQIGGGKETLDSCLSRGEQLWCDAKASWGSTPGVQGWCNSNCHKGACNFERCACSCISQAEYDFRAGGSAGTQKV